MHRSVFLLFILVLTGIPVEAQVVDPVPTGGEQITLTEAIRNALAERTEVQRARVGAEAQALAVKAARTENRWPTLSASVRPSQTYGLIFDQTTGQLATQSSTALNLGLSAQWTIYDGGRRSATVNQVLLEHEASERSLERTHQQVAVGVAERFLQLLLDRELVNVQERALEDAERQLTFIESLVEGGARPRADISAQRAVVAERKGTLIDARTAVARDEALLIEAADLDPLTEYEFTGPTLDELAQTGLLVPTFPELDSLLAIAIERRSDLAAQRLRAEAAEANVGVARALSQPSLSATGNLGTGYSSLQERLINPNDPGTEIPVTLPDGTPVLVGGTPFTITQPNTETEQTPLFTQLGDNRSGSVGLTLSIPLFDGLQRRRQIEQAQIQAEDSRLQLEGLEKQAAAEVQQSLIESRAAFERYEVALERVAAAQEAAQYEEDRYELGAGTLYTLADARSRLADAESARVQAAYQLVFQTTLLRFTTGEFSVDNLPEWAN